MTSGDATTYRRRIGGVALILAPLFNWTAALLSPIGSETSAVDQLNAVALHTDRAMLSALFDLFGVVFFIPAVLAVVHLLTPRAPRLAHIGGAMNLAGLVGFAGVHTLSIVQVEMVKGGADRAEMVALLDRLNESAGIAVVAALFLLLMIPGVLLLSIGLFLTSSVPRWLPVLTWVFLIWDVGLGVSGIDPQIAGVIDPHMVGFIGYAIMGLLVLRESDEDWEQGHALTWPPGSAPLPAATQA